MGTHGRLVGTVIAALLALASVGPTRPAVAYEGGVVQNGGTITGRVRVVGEVVPLPPQPVYKHVAECGTTVPDERLVLGRGGMLEFAVATLRDVERGKPMPTGPVVLHNRTCAFVPHVQSASVGQMLEIVNDDPFLHDAHAWLGDRTLFNLAIPRGRTVHHVLDDPGVIHVNCNVRHTWMHGYLVVVPNPYHAVSGPDGTFTIGDVPPGTHHVRIWHEMLGSLEQDVTVPPGGTVTVTADFPAVAPAP